MSAHRNRYGYDGLFTFISQRRGREENKTTSNRIAKKEEKTLLNHLEKYKENYLLFLRDFRVYFDDNIFNHAAYSFIFSTSS